MVEARTGMHVRSAPLAQAGLSAAAAASAVAFGASWLGLGWVYEVRVRGAEFVLGPEFGLGLLAAVLMGAAAGAVRAHGGARGASLALGVGGGAIFASSLWLLLVWAPGGAPAGQLALLQDASRLGYALLALALPLALPAGVRPVARGAAMAVGIVLAPVLLFPDHVEQAGLADARATLPMVLFLAQAGLALSGLGALTAGRGWGRRHRAAAAEPEAHFLRAYVVRRPARAPARPPRLPREPLFNAPSGPRGPDRPRAPSPSQRAAPLRSSWWFQF